MIHKLVVRDQTLGRAPLMQEVLKPKAGTFYHFFTQRTVVTRGGAVDNVRASLGSMLLAAQCRGEQLQSRGRPGREIGGLYDSAVKCQLGSEGSAVKNVK